MAGNELAEKLRRRNQIIEAAEAAEAAEKSEKSAEKSAKNPTKKSAEKSAEKPTPAKKPKEAASRQISACSSNDQALSIVTSPGPVTSSGSVTSPGPLTSPNMPSLNIWNPYTEFKELSRKELQHYQQVFKQYDVNGDKHIDFTELKLMMEKIGSPQTHLSLKAMIQEVDEDKDNRISFREFLLILHKARAGELSEDSGLLDLYRHVTHVDVTKVGIKAAANFFDARVAELTETSKFEQEIKAEREEKQRVAEEKKQRRAAFKATAGYFEQQMRR